MATRKLLLAFQMAGCVILLGGCDLEMYTREGMHKNFVDAIQANVGQTLESLQVSGWANPKKLISKTTMPDGLIAYRYFEYEGCSYTYEVDPGTHTIKAAHVDGTACILTP